MIGSCSFGILILSAEFGFSLGSDRDMAQGQQWPLARLEQCDGVMRCTFFLRMVAVQQAGREISSY